MRYNIQSNLPDAVSISKAISKHFIVSGLIINKANAQIKALAD